ncbi:hypothetical protein ACVWXO_005668 [Bradyrhizobium sp. LM2.7]
MLCQFFFDFLTMQMIDPFSKIAHVKHLAADRASEEMIAFPLDFPAPFVSV